MRVYLDSRRNHTLMVTPGAQHADVSDWLDDKKQPKRFDIKFVDGMASVDDKMAKYLVELGLANRTRLVRVTRELIAAAGM